MRLRSARRAETVRAFLAVDLPPPALAEWSPDPEAPPHLTLAFLGEVDEERGAALAAALTERLAGRAPFDVALAGVGAFPDERRPRVVWVGCSVGAEELRGLAEEVRGVLRTLGLPVEARPFVPHLTLFRVRGKGSADRAARLLHGAPTGELGRTRVREVLLKSSTLGPQGATHRVVARCPLGGRGPD